MPVSFYLELIVLVVHACCFLQILAMINFYLLCQQASFLDFFLSLKHKALLEIMKDRIHLLDQLLFIWMFLEWYFPGARILEKHSLLRHFDLDGVFHEIFIKNLDNYYYKLKKH